MLDNHILPELGKYQLRDVTSEHVQSLILSKIAEGKSPQTVWHIRATISALFKKAKGIKWFSGELPTEGIEMPALTHRERAALTKEQAILLLQRLPLRTRGMVLALALTGLRIGELLGLKWKRVNLTDKPIVCGPDLVEPRTAAIRETWVKVYGKHLGANTARGQYQDVKNVKNGPRDVPLLSLVVDALRKIRAESVFTGPDDPVFASSTGKPIDANNELARHLKPAVAALRSEGQSIPPISWHDLRHTASTLADQAGLSEAEKQRILGHSEKMTRHYTKAHLHHARMLMDHMQEGLEAAAMPRLRRVK
jgi:integrase